MMMMILIIIIKNNNNLFIDNKANYYKLFTINVAEEKKYSVKALFTSHFIS